MDRRESILARLAVILAGIDGIRSSWRNRGELQSDKRPASVLLDGLETADEGAFTRGRQVASKNIVVLRPEIYVLLQDARLDSATVGTELNNWRRKVILAIQGDAALIALLGSNGHINYLGTETDMASGRPMQGEIRVDFAFGYVFDPRELAN